MENKTPQQLIFDNAKPVSELHHAMMVIPEQKAYEIVSLVQSSMVSKWVKIGDRVPTNANRYPGAKDTPYIPCMVWICHPNTGVKHGVLRLCRWDSKNKEWLKEDMMFDYLFQPPYIITHFIDQYEGPEGPAL